MVGIRDDSKHHKYAEKELNQISETNRGLAGRYLVAKKAQGSRPATLAWTAHQMRLLDDFCGGRPFLDLTQDDLSSILAAFGETYAPSSTRLFVAHLKGMYAWANGGECPNFVRQAFKRLPAVKPATVEPLSQPDFEALLRAAGEMMPRRRAAYQQALLWFFWDSGFRLGEVLAVKIGGVRISEDGMSAKISLPDDVPGLKSGPRSIFVSEAVPSLRVWLSMHPKQEDADAFVFSGFQTQELLHKDSLYQTLALLCDRAGITRRVHPHLFRHTRATRAALNGWKEAKLRAHFGWGATSEMPTHYVHLAESDMEETVRRDAAADPLGALVKQDPKDIMKDALGAVMESLVDKLEKRGKL